ncbi:STAS domain-containing protein [Cellvibrio sp. NN19]|uniref:STAS domain-containing protein n=1 Tax=Cellvibrio chitinivorans TaxID=3102792 RepID=UPI002B41747B|nr:STAS domain-containing protein [Cellvibrio sp. NN19]
MRHLVPFVGEQHLMRADDEQGRSKRMTGRVIDDVVGDGKVESSWDDLVPAGWIDKTKPKPMASVANTLVPKTKVPLKVQPKTASNPAKSAVSKASSASAAITFSDTASMDWVSINNGRGLRINIYGNIDNDLRKEWSRLLSDAEAAQIKEFEFNLSEAPALSLTGLGMLLLFKERKGKACDVIKLCNCNKEVARLLYWTGMDKYFVIETTKISEQN